MTNAITHYLSDNGLNTWQVHAHWWVKKANTTIFQVLGVAGGEGKSLGMCLTKQSWSHIHFVAHSAGSALIQTASEIIKGDPLNTTTVHTTFLDPYVGIVYNGRTKYGRYSDWSDSYFSHDLETQGERAHLTEGPMEHAYNVDVTLLDPLVVPCTPSETSSGSTIPYFCNTSAHGWPHEFYTRTIPTNTVLDSEGFGFPLSKEGGNWDHATNQYRMRGNSPLVLGCNQPPCPSVFSVTPLVRETYALDFGVSPVVLGPSGSIQTTTRGFFVTTASMLPPAPDRLMAMASPQSRASAWIVVAVTITNTINFISFEMEFISNTQAEGLLSVYWDTNTIGSIDERVTTPELGEYTYLLPERVTSGTHLLGFRLDSYTNTNSSVIVTNVVLGLSGISEPFTLSALGVNTNGLQTFKLLGPSNYTYIVETSSNLMNWNPLVFLVNTNGVVEFTDYKSTNATARFYRAIAP